MLSRESNTIELELRRRESMTMGLFWLAVFTVAGGIAVSGIYSVWLPFVAAALLLGFIVAVVNPSLPYYVLLALIGFQTFIFAIRSEMLMWYTVSDFLALLCFSAWLISRFMHPRKAFFDPRTDVPLVLFLGWAFVSMLWSHKKHIGYYWLSILFCHVLVYYLAAELIDTPRKAKWALLILLWTALITTGICFYSTYSHYTTFQYLWDYREYAVIYYFNLSESLRGQGFMHPLATGYYLSLMGIMTLGLVYASRGVRRGLYAVAAFILMAGMISTVSKGPILSWLCGVFLLSLMIARLRKNLILTWLAVPVLVVAAFAVSRLPSEDLQTAMRYVSESASDTDAESSSLGSRLTRWRKAVDNLYETNGWGAGAGGYFEYLAPEPMLDNQYLQVMAEYGYIGLAFWLWFIGATGYAVYTAWKQRAKGLYRKWGLIYMAGLATLLLNGLTSFEHYLIFIWVYLGFGRVYVRLVAAKSPLMEKVC